ncbi:recombinase family protein [Paenibacillus sp. JNUCC31]|uniref:recombinase family protein n=1 Tax=Paenibacillus sp. JNUCC-31 TaxID=2777983 RepID=UPI00177C65C5|nr:recombinase family protein [Paenibacillus sp. JNUCC-31]QOS77925.1 recombinase family protein [Paenibacillus sp. JNUCC-31]QOS77966.1 recombinase family protein [Paenibacillus sp. JNUCC-31]
MSNVAAYIRVSTDEQADKGNSLNEQQERLKAYCVAMGWSEPTFYIDDGYSAKDLRRPAIKKLLDDVTEGKLQIVLTSKLDRLCRNLLDLLQTVKLLTQYNCSYVSASESFDTSTAVGRMTLQLLGTFAEFERERTSERVKDNMISLAKNTDRAIVGPCYGYDVIDKKYVINEEEAKNVRYMFELAEQGDGYRMIAKKLNDRGITTKRNKMFDQINVKRLITNQALTGTMIYNKRSTKDSKTTFRDESEWIVKEGNHSPIIPIEQFEKVQEILRSRSRARKHADNETYLLTGLAKCGHCERNMKGSTARVKRKYNDYTYYRYICGSYQLGYGCKHHAVHREDLETLIIEQIRELVAASTKELNINISPRASAIDEIKDLKSQLSKVGNKMQKQIEAFENDLISAEDLKAARMRVEADRDSLNKRISQLLSKKYEAETVQKNAALMLPDILGADRLKAKQAIRQIIEQVTITNGEQIEIVWK